MMWNLSSPLYSMVLIAWPEAKNKALFKSWSIIFQLFFNPSIFFKGYSQSFCHLVRSFSFHFRVTVPSLVMLLSLPADLIYLQTDLELRFSCSPGLCVCVRGVLLKGFNGHLPDSQKQVLSVSNSCMYGSVLSHVGYSQNSTWTVWEL